MSCKGMMLIALFLATVSGQCNRSSMPLPADEEPVHSVSFPAEGAVQLSDAACEAVGMTMCEAKSKACKSMLKAMGKTLAPQPQTAILSYAYAGRVSEIHAGVGDWVEEGQALITLESHDVGEAMADFFRASANSELAKLNFEREERLLEEGIGVKKNFAAAEAEYKVAQASAEAAHKRLHVLGFTDEEVDEIAGSHRISPAIKLYSPIAGKVIEIEAVLGSMVDPSTEILTVLDPRLLWVDAEIYEKDLAKVEVGQEAEIVVPAYPDEVFRGKIVHVADVVDAETRTITVRAEVANDDQRLKPGMFADVRILLDPGRPTVVVPPGAVLEEGDRKVVFVKEGDRYRVREVETGPVDGDDLIVTAGLTPGERVVVEGNFQLRSVLREDVLEAAHTH